LDRLSQRGDESWSLEEIVQFDGAELAHGEFVARSLGINFSVLFEPSRDEFLKGIQDFSK
jgi:hypothetical protein